MRIATGVWELNPTATSPFYAWRARALGPKWIPGRLELMPLRTVGKGWEPEPPAHAAAGL